MYPKGWKLRRTARTLEPIICSSPLAERTNLPFKTSENHAYVLQAQGVIATLSFHGSKRSTPWSGSRRQCHLLLFVPLQFQCQQPLSVRDPRVQVVVVGDIGPSLGPHLEHMRWSDPRLGKATLDQ